MTPRIRVLCVDDYALDRELVRDALERENCDYTVTEASNKEEFERILEEDEFDIVLSDFNILGFQGLQVLEMVQAKKPHIPVVVVTGTGSEEIAVEAMKRGASDYVIKTPAHIRRLPYTIQTAIEKFRLRAEGENAQRELKERESYYRALLQNIHEDILVIDANYAINDVNDTFLKANHLTKEEVIGQKCFKLLHGQSAPCEEYSDSCPILSVSSTGNSHHCIHEYRYGGTDQRKRWMDILASPIGSTATGCSKVVVAIRDISNVKLAELAAKESEERFSKAFQASPVWVVLSTLDGGRYIEVNETFLKTTGFTRDEVIGHTSIELKTWSNPEDRAKVVAQLKAQGSVRNVEVKRRTKTGEMLDTLFFADILEIAGQPCLLSVSMDITERNRADQALKESERKYRLLIEHSSDAIFIAQDGRIKFPNPRAIEITGFPEEELTGRPFQEFIHPEDREMVIERHKKRMEGQPVASSYSFRIYQRSGEELWVQLNAVLIEWEGKPATLNFLRDITDERKKQTRIQQVQKLEALGTLAAGIAHDFNNILSASIGYTELAVKEVSRGSELEEYLRQILAANYRARHLVKQILSFSKQSEQELKPFSILSVVEEALKLLRSTLPTTIQIEKEFCEERATVFGDPTQIHQVLMNLCSNAADAMSVEGGALQIKMEKLEVEAEFMARHVELEPGKYVRLTVSDTGVGIPEEVLSRIFDPYFTTKASGKGTGLGLAVAHGIIQSLGGTITVYSEVGRGTTFHVYLPLVDLTEDSAGAMEKPLPKGSETVLFVDDEPIIIELNKRILQKLGYKVESRTNGLEALELFRNHPDRFDLVITDMTMPHISGDKLARELIKIRPDIPVILCTGYSENLTEERAREIGIREYLMKPLLMNELAEAIRRALNG